MFKKKEFSKIYLASFFFLILIISISAAIIFEKKKKDNNQKIITLNLDTKVVENFKSILETLLKEKPDGIKGDFIISAFLTSTMGVSYKLNLDNK